MEWVLAPELASSGYCEDPLCEALSIAGLVAKAELSPLDGGPDIALRDVVCGLDSFVKEESEEMVPVVQQSFGSSAYVCIRAGKIPLTGAFHPRPHQLGCVEELLTRNVATSEGIPATEDAADFLEHVFRKNVGVRAGATIFERLQLSDDVSPAELADSVLVVRTVGRVIIGGDHTREDIAQDGFEDLGSPACSYGKVHSQWSYEHPEITSISFALPSSLVNIEVVGPGKGLSYLFGSRFQLGADSFDTIAYASKTQVQTKKSIQDLDDASSANLMDRREVGDRPMNARAELALRHLRWKLGTCLVTTRAFQFMTAVLLHYGFDLRKLKRLVSCRFRSFRTTLRVQGSAAFSAYMRVMVMYFIHLLDRSQLPLVPFMSLLSARRARRFFLFRFDHPGTI